MEQLASEAGDGYGYPVEMHVWVVSPKMARLLDKLGYESTATRGEWSLDDPYYRKDIS